MLNFVPFFVLFFVFLYHFCVEFWNFLQQSLQFRVFFFLYCFIIVASFFVTFLRPFGVVFGAFSVSSTYMCSHQCRGVFNAKKNVRAIFLSCSCRFFSFSGRFRAVSSHLHSLIEIPLK